MYIDAEAHAALKRSQLQAGDVLISIAGTLGRAAVVQEADVPANTNQAVAIVRPEPVVVPQYLAHAFDASLVRSAVAEGGRGVGIQNLNLEQVTKLPILIAPLPEQHRIVAAIEDHFSRLDEAVALLERVQRNLKRYRASVLKAAVEGRLVPTEADLARAEGRTYEPATKLLERILEERRRRWKENGGKGTYKEPVAPDTTDLPELPEGWCWVQLDTIGDVILGQQRSPSHAAAEKVTPYIRAANITWEGIDLSDVKSMGFDNPERHQLKVGDVLLSEASGSPMEAGKPAVWQGQIPGACFQNTVVRVRVHDQQAVLPEYLQAVFLNDCWCGRFAHLAPGVGIVHLGAERMARWAVPLCPTSAQRRIVAMLDDMQSVVRETKRSVVVNLARCTRLRQSILKWAFEGRLADQDPADEPASVLLERIRAERTSRNPARGSFSSSRRMRKTVGDTRTE